MRTYSRWSRTTRRWPSPLTAACVICASCTAPGPKPPLAPVIPHERMIHGDRRVDNYFWLRERDNPDVIAYLEAENRYTNAIMAHTKDLQQRLYQEMKARIEETDLTVPTKIDDYYYYTRTFEGKQYRVHCRKHGSLDAEEEILLDVNAMAKGHKYFEVGIFQISPNHNLLAYSVDTTGGESYTLYVKDLESGQLLPDQIDNVYYSVTWANDNKTLFYNILDHAKRPFQVYRHVLGTDPSKDRLIHHETDERFFVGISKTRSRAYLLLWMASQITSEAHYLDADQPMGEFALIQPRKQGVEYSIEHHEDSFYITTNDDAINFRLVKAPVTAPGKKNWEEVIPHRSNVKIDGVDAFADYLAVYERDKGLRRLRIIDLQSGEHHYVAFPEPVYTFFAMGNEQFFTNILRFSYASLLTPRSVFDYNMQTRTRELKKQEEVLGGYDPLQYKSERICAVASDGTQIPISVVYRCGLVRNGENPALLTGYGSYGASREPYFSSNRLSLLDRGFVYAIAHVRGGGDMGRPWYEAGKLLNKMNTFTDFVACAEHLITQGYTSKDRLATIGGSAGGLLMGAVTNMRPDLFETVVAQVPFVDVLNTMLDPTIPLTVIEFEEWGNPNDSTYYEYMKRYSPYDNVSPQDYPNILVTAGLNDPRVQYWEPAKWVAKLRTTKTDSNRLLLKTNMGTGHGGASGRYDALREEAFEYAFVLDTLGIKE